MTSRCQRRSASCDCGWCCVFRTWVLTKAMFGRRQVSSMGRASDRVIWLSRVQFPYHQGERQVLTCLSLSSPEFGPRSLATSTTGRFPPAERSLNVGSIPSAKHSRYGLESRRSSIRYQPRYREWHAYLPCFRPQLWAKAAFCGRLPRPRGTAAIPRRALFVRGW
jgi:hypothetical protein